MSENGTTFQKYTTKEVAVMLGWNYHTLRNYLRRESLKPAQQIGRGDWLWSLSEIEKVREFRATNTDKGGRPRKQPASQ